MSLVSMVTRTASSGVASRRPPSRTTNAGPRVFRGGRHDASEEPQDGVAIRVNGVAVRAHEPDTGDDEQDAEQVDHPVGRGKDGRARGDEHRTEDDRPEDPPEQQPVLVRRRHREGREDQGEHEDVVDREGQLDQVAREILRARITAPGRCDERPEAEGEADPHRAPCGRLPEGQGLRVPVDDEEVEGEHAAHDDGQDHPRTFVSGHPAPSGSCAEGLSRPRSCAVGRSGPRRVAGMTPRTRWDTPLRVQGPTGGSRGSRGGRTDCGRTGTTADPCIIRP